jgi:hypothetical protein
MTPRELEEPGEPEGPKEPEEPIPSPSPSPKPKVKRVTKSEAAAAECVTEETTSEQSELSILHGPQTTDVVTELVLLVPQASSKRVSVTLLLSFEDVLEMIHEIIGCTNVARKPAISYKLSTATQRAKPIDLCSEVDWNGCLEDVMAAEAKKKNQPVPILIIVPDQVCSFMMTYVFFGHSLTRTIGIVHELTPSPHCNEEETCEGEENSLAGS